MRVMYGRHGIIAPKKKSEEAALTACTQAIGSGCQIMVNG